MRDKAPFRCSNTNGCYPRFTVASHDDLDQEAKKLTDTDLAERRKSPLGSGRCVVQPECREIDDVPEQQCPAIVERARVLAIALENQKRLGETQGLDITADKVVGHGCDDRLQCFAWRPVAGYQARGGCCRVDSSSVPILSGIEAPGKGLAIVGERKDQAAADPVDQPALAQDPASTCPSMRPPPGS